MNKTDIDWCDMSWNPVTGCLHSCEYCYARVIARRFAGFEPRCGGEEIPEGVGTCVGSINNTTHGEALHVFNKQPQRRLFVRGYPNGKFMSASYPYGFEPTFHKYRLDEPARKQKPQTIFVGSMTDMFGEWVPDEWIREIFEYTNKAPQHRYLYLTKNPDRYFQLGEGDDTIIPVGGVSGWFGASATTEKQAEKAYENLNCTWMSLEPLHGEFSEEFFVHDNRYTQDIERRWAWIVVGAETGNRKDKIMPQRLWLGAIVQNCLETKTPLFMKNSLHDIWGETLIQEYPWEVS